MRALIDSRMRARLDDFWPSLTTIQQITYTLTAAKQKIPSGTQNVLVGIKSRLGPIIDSRPTDEEVRQAGILTIMTRRYLKLNGYFPQILPFAMQAMVDGVVYQIWGVESDSQGFCSRLRLVQLNP